MKGHWQGDESCPKRKPGKGQGAAKAKKKPLPKKVPGKTTYFVLHPDLEEGDGAGQAYLVDPQDAGKEPCTRFSNATEHTGPDLEHDVLVNLRTNLCEHASSNGGREKKFHRSANGHTRSIMCKEPECDKAVIQARRKEVALCTLWGTKARSRALFSRVGQVVGGFFLGTSACGPDRSARAPAGACLGLWCVPFWSNGAAEVPRAYGRGPGYLDATPDGELPLRNRVSLLWRDVWPREFQRRVCLVLFPSNVLRPGKQPYAP